MRTENLVNYYFTKDHEWFLPKMQFGTVGITDYAQHSMGDMIYVELPKPGDKFEAHEAFGSIESIKTVSEVYVPVDCEVIEVNKGLNDKPEVVNSDPYKNGWMIKVRPTKEQSTDSLLNFVEYKAYTDEVEHILYLDEANQIHYLTAVRGEDGRVVVNTGSFESIFTSPLINYSQPNRKEIVEEFEYLMNKKNLKEYEMQRFFEEHQEFLLGIDYEELHSQVVLKREDDDSLKPDFILKPLVGVSYQPNIVELKLPGEKIIKPTRRREGLYANIYEAVMQLRAYARYFDEQKNREYVKKELGFTAYRPKLTLIVGKTVSFAYENVSADILQAIQPVELVTYNDLLQKYKKLIGR